MLLAMALAVADPKPVCAGVTLQAAIEDYAARIRAMDLDRIGALFGPDGVAETSGRTLTGSAENAAALRAFSAYRVTEETLTVESVARAPNGWSAAVHFHQTGLTPDAKPYDVQGRLQIVWHCVGTDWRIARLSTLPG